MKSFDAWMRDWSKEEIEEAKAPIQEFLSSEKKVYYPPVFVVSIGAMENEIVNITNYEYPPFHYMRYGAIPDGVMDSTVEMQALLKDG